jgi:hypothetical protein
VGALKESQRFNPVCHMPRSWTLKFASIVAACCAALMQGGCTTSPGTSDTVEGSFIRAAATWDLNHDGKVTCDEWRSYARSLFKEVDLNHDGKLTPDEFQRLAKIDRLFETANFKYYDVAGQGYITEPEFIDRPNPAFAALDKNNTCVLSTYQLRAATSEDTPKRENPAIPGAR